MRLSCLSPLHRTIPGDNMDNTSMENPFKKLLSVAQTNLDWPGSLSLFGQNTGQKRKGQNLLASAQFMALVSALRSLSSVALPSTRVPLVYHSFFQSSTKGTSLLCRLGDISTLH